MRIGITGIEGLIGWHLHAFLHGQAGVSVVGANRKTFASKSDLSDFVASCDVVVHLAGMNRGDAKIVADTNIALVKDLISACENTNSKSHVIFSSSTQIFQDTPYGNSKKECTRLFQNYSERTGALFTNLILPNIFGESGKPYYNSVVSTFCYQIANNLSPQIIDDNETEQLHAQSLAKQIYNTINTPVTGDVLPAGTRIFVSELLNRIRDFDEKYRQQIIPELKNRFDLQLFNTYRSYLFPDRYPVPSKLHTDERGMLFEAVKGMIIGQIFISSTKPGIARGNHYHTQKLERFLVLNGDAKIKIRKLFSKKIITFEVNGKKPQYIDIPTLHTHTITNTGDGELITLFWSHNIFDPAHPDTYPEAVQGEK